MKDDRVCPVCQALEGYTWIFEVGTNQLDGRLDHPTYGTVWDIANGSQAHGHEGNCRCNISYIVEIHDLLNRVKTIRDKLLEIVPVPGEKT